MRYLYIVGLILITGLYTFSSGSHYTGGDDDDDRGGYNSRNDDDRGGDDDDRGGDDDDRGGGDDDDRGGGYGNSNNNYLEVNVNSMCNFTCINPNHLEQDQIINNAIRLKFKTKNRNCSIYAKIGTYNYPSGAAFSSIPLYLKYRSDNSSSVQSLVTNQLRLLQTDQRLFVQPKKSQTFQFYYDLVLGPIGYESPTGQYTYSIVFTMTQP